MDIKLEDITTFNDISTESLNGKLSNTQARCKVLGYN